MRAFPTASVRRWLSERGPAFGAAAVVAALVVAAFLARLELLLGSPYPVGIDGYWYPIQLRSLLERGHLYYPSAPLVPWLMAPLAALGDPVLGAKIGAAAGTAMLVVPVYLLGRRLSGERAPALLAAVLAATSGQSAYLSTEFVKEGVGLTLAAGFAVAFGRALDRATPARVVGAAGLLAACLLTHKTAFGLALLVGAPPLAGRLLVLLDVGAPGLAAARARRRRARAAIVAGGAAVALGVAGVLWPRQFLGAHDLGLAAGLFTDAPDWSLATLALPGRRPLRFTHEVPLAAAAAVVLVALAAWTALAARRPERVSAPPAPFPLPALSIGLVAFALFLGVPWLDTADAQGLAYRLRLAAHVALAPLAALVAVRLLVRAPLAGRGLVCLGIAAGLLVARPLATREGVVFTKASMASAVRSIEDAAPPDAVIVTQSRHIAFMVTWYTRRPAWLTPRPPAEAPRVLRLLPAASIGPELRAALDELDRERPPGVVPIRDLDPRHPRALVLVSEGTWEVLTARLPAKARARHEAWEVR